MGESEDFSRSVDIGGRTLHMTCKGKGRPTVVMESGVTRSGDDWAAVQALIAPSVRACTYDRAGLGRSDPRPALPCTIQDMVDDLRALLTGADLPGPYILVGHSLGGLITRLYAGQHPEDVVGMVLVDTIASDAFERWLEQLPQASPDEPVGITGLRQWVTQTHLPVESLAWPIGDEQAEAVGDLGDIPLVVLTPREPVLSRGFGITGEPAARLDRLDYEMQQELAALTPNGSLIFVDDCGHLMQLDQPQAVADAILSVVTQVRGA
jgi:pimeloyl-ACP methyl ester carboxylesterase